MKRADQPQAWADPLVPDTLPISRSWVYQRSYCGCLINDVFHAEWKCPHYHRTQDAALKCAKSEARRRDKAMRAWRGLPQ